MAGRLALVIGSECDAFPRELGFTGTLATGLYSTLIDSGGWRPVLGHGDGPLLNPKIKRLRKSVREAFKAADDARARLLIAFIGHGVATGEKDFFLLARNSPTNPDSETGFHLTQRTRELLNEYRSIDGLIVLVDACEAGQALTGAGDRWINLLSGFSDKDDNGAGARTRGSGRLELLVASGARDAYDGCFTRTVTATLQTGVPTGGEDLRCHDLYPFVAQCEGQNPGHLAFNNGWVAVSDPGLDLVPNPARAQDAVTRRASAGLVDQLTGDVVITDTIREHLIDLAYLATGARLQLVVGPPGCGKSTLMSLLIRPNIVDTLTVNPDHISAAAFLDATSTLESLTQEWVGQLEARVGGYRDARRAVHGELSDEDKQTITSFEQDIMRPLRRCRGRGQRVRLLVDGLDQAAGGGREKMLAAIGALTDPDRGVDHVYVIAGVRSGTGVAESAELHHARRVELSNPSPEDLAEAIGPQWGQSLIRQIPGGSWLIARLINEIDSTIVPPSNTTDLLTVLVDARFQNAVQRAFDPDALIALTSLLVAAGVGPVMPLALVVEALERLGHRMPVPYVRDLIAVLGVLVSRGHPGLDDETLGISHNEFLAAVEEAGRVSQPNAMLAAHRAISSALSTIWAQDAPTPGLKVYLHSAGPRHYLAAGEPDTALAVLQNSETDRAADNRDLWATWLPTFAENVGADHPATIVVRNNLASWRAQSGDVAGAVTELEALIIDQLKVLGADHPHTLAARKNLASCRRDAGTVARAVTELEALIIDQFRVLGADHPHTLSTRNDLALCRVKGGDAATAVTELQALIIDQLRVLGANHPHTLATRSNLAYCRGKLGDFAGHVEELSVLLTETVRVLGPDDPGTLMVRNNLAAGRMKCGDFALAYKEFAELVTVRTSVLGADHPDTLRSRYGLATCCGESGDIAGAAIEFAALLIDQLRVLGTDHPDTLLTRNNLALCRAMQGDAAGVTELEALLIDQLRVLGADHPQILETRRNLSFLRGRSDD